MPTTNRLETFPGQFNIDRSAPRYEPAAWRHLSGRTIDRRRARQKVDWLTVEISELRLKGRRCEGRRQDAPIGRDDSYGSRGRSDRPRRTARTLRS